MNKGSSRFLTVFTLLSRIPVGRKFEADWSRSDYWIPAVSPLVSALALAGAGLGALLFRDPLLAALAALAAQYLGFNLFHLDGLLDSADAMACLASREKREEILKDPRLGSYAFFWGWLLLAGKLAALALLFKGGPRNGVLALLAAPLAGRLACVLVPLLARPARTTGLGALMARFSRLRVAQGTLTGMVPLLVFGLASSPTPRAIIPGGVAVLGTLVAGAGAGLGLAKLYRERLGGFTGDALGAAVEAGELLALLLLAAVLPRLG